MAGIKDIEVKRILAGHFRPAELRRYAAVMSLIFWGIIALCWVMYPTENKWWIASHTFSFLGSFSENRNPTWWWLFSVAMIFWAVASVPLTLYIIRRFAVVSRWGAWVGGFLFFMGTVGIVLVALFPDVSAPLYGELRWTEVHTIVAVICFAGFGLGIFWLGFLLLKDRFLPGRGRTSFFRHRHVVGPYALFTVMFCVSAYFLRKWDILYAAKKAAAQAAGEKIGSSWSESMNTIYAFPLWENLLIYTLFIFIIWLALAIPRELEAPSTGWDEASG